MSKNTMKNEDPYDLFLKDLTNLKNMKLIEIIATSQEPLSGPEIEDKAKKIRKEEEEKAYVNQKKRKSEKYIYERLKTFAPLGFKRETSIMCWEDFFNRKQNNKNSYHTLKKLNNLLDLGWEKGKKPA